MRYRTFPGTDLTLSEIGFGVWTVSTDWWGVTETDLRHSLLRTAFEEHGITHFNTADTYGDGLGETILADVLGDVRDQIAIVTKFGYDLTDHDGRPGHRERKQNFDPAFVRQACEASLKRLNTDRIDLYEAHNIREDDIRRDDLLDELERLREQGKIRYIGVSNFGPRDLTDALDLAPIVSNQLAYSLLARSIEFEVQPLCVEHGISILPYSPLAQGLLTGKFHRQEDVPDGRARTRHFPSSRAQTRHGEPGCPEATFAAIDRIRAVAERLNQPMAAVALSWLLHQPAVTSVLAGARRPDQVAQNIRAAEVALDEDTLAELAAATDPVKQHLGPRPDLWTSAQDCRMR